MFTATVEVHAATKEQARSLLEAHGFTVTRVTAPRATTVGVTGRNPFIRPSSRTDRPAGLDKLEAVAYVRGYAKACLTYARKNGIPRTEQPGREALCAVTRAYEWDRHPTAHKAGMAELAKEQGHPSRVRVEAVA